MDIKSAANAPQNALLMNGESPDYEQLVTFLLNGIKPGHSTGSWPVSVLPNHVSRHSSPVNANSDAWLNAGTDFSRFLFPSNILGEGCDVKSLFSTLHAPSTYPDSLLGSLTVPVNKITIKNEFEMPASDSAHKNICSDHIDAATGYRRESRGTATEIIESYDSKSTENRENKDSSAFESTDSQVLATGNTPNPGSTAYAQSSSANSFMSLFSPPTNSSSSPPSTPSSDPGSGQGSPSSTGSPSSPGSPGSQPNDPPSENSLRAYIESNPLFGAGFGLMALGAVLAASRRALTSISSLARRALIIDLEIASKDASYDWFLEFLAKNERSIASRSLAVETSYKQHASGSISASFNLVPGLGTHLVKWGSAHVLATRERSGRLMDNSRNRPFETLKLQTLYMYRNVFSEMLEAAQKAAQSRNSGKTVLYTSLGPEWRPFGQPRRKRLLTSVVLAPGVKESLENDVNAFLNSQQWYADRGVPYRRGYLLYGPPGSGKTSVIQALAGALDYNICILNLAELTLTDDRLNHLLNNVPPRSFVLLEDVDAAFNEIRKQNDGFRSGITFSGLLNALDGVTSAESRLVFMTTNHPDRLDPALVRPGRVDFKVLLDNASPRQVRDMFYQFYNDAELAEEFVNKIIERGEPVSTATLQGLFIFHKDDPKGAIEAVANWS